MRSRGWLLGCLAIPWGIVCFLGTAAANVDVHGEPLYPLQGRLANPGFENARIKATLFFSGQARDGTRPYECYAGPNLGLYTVHPEDDRHLNWSTVSENRSFAVDQMKAAGLNVIAFSSRGEDFLPCTTGWSHWAPMQSSPQSHDEVFDAAKDRSLLVMPFIESRADWGFRHEFPRWGNDVAPGTVNQIP